MRAARNRSFWRGIVTILLLMTGPLASGEESRPPIVIKAARILPIEGPTVLDGVIVIEKGKIVCVGRDCITPPGAEVIDAGTGWVLPGLIQTCTTLGASRPYGGGSESDEISDPNTAQLLITDGINPFDKGLVRARMAGITTILAAPGRLNVIGGQAAVLKLSGITVEDMILSSPVGIKISLGEGPKTTYGRKGRLPTTRMGNAYVLRRALIEAGQYRLRWEAYQKQKRKDGKSKGESPPMPPKRDLRLEPLARLLEGTLTAFIECYRADDIMTALRIVDEFQLKAVLMGASEGGKLADRIAAAGTPVIVGPFGVGPRRMETENLTWSLAAGLSAAGVKVVIRAEESLGVGHVRELLLQAALAVRGGLDRETALRAVTLSAAEAAGVADRIGSLKPGKDGDLIIVDGDPLHYRTRILRVLIEGRTVFKSENDREPLHD